MTMVVEVSHMTPADARTITRPAIGVGPPAASLTLRERGLLHVLEELVDCDGVVVAVQSLLAEEIGSPLRNLQRYLTGLESAGYITRATVYDDRGPAATRIALTYPV